MNYLKFKSLLSYAIYGSIGASIAYLSFKNFDAFSLWLANFDIFSSTNSLPDSKIKQQISENIPAIPILNQTTLTQTNSSIEAIATLNESSITEKTASIIEPILQENNNQNIESVITDFSSANVITNPYIKDSTLSALFNFNEMHAFCYTQKIQGYSAEETISRMHNHEIVEDLQKNWTCLINKLTIEETYIYLSNVIRDNLEINYMQKETIKFQKEFLEIFVAKNCVEYHADTHSDVLQVLKESKEIYPLLFESKIPDLNHDDLVNLHEILKIQLERAPNPETLYFKERTNLLNHWKLTGYFNQFTTGYDDALDEIRCKEEQYKNMLTTIEKINENITGVETNKSPFSLTIPVILTVCSAIVIGYYSFLTVDI